MSRLCAARLVVICIGSLALVSALVASVDLKRDYNGFSVIRAVPQTEQQLAHLRDLMKVADDDDGRSGLQFWSSPRVLNASVDVMVGPGQLAELSEKLSKWSIAHSEMMADVGANIRKISTGDEISLLNRNQILGNSTLRQLMAARSYYSRYQRYSGIEAKLKFLAELDERIQIETIGRSTEKRALYLVKVSEDYTAKKPVILIDAGHHAREWISHSTLIYLLESLVNIDMPRMASSACQTERCRRPKLDLKKFDFWFIPVVNPDGYEYTHTTERLWRKTRSGGPYCAGVDPNRNYNHHWAEAGASRYACSDIYAGPKPASEPEVRAVTAVMDQNKGRIIAYLSLHAYSQLIMSPYGHDRVYPHNYAELEVAATKFIRALGSLRRTEYKFGTTAVTLYPASGGSDDYAHENANIRYSYTIELPDQVGGHGFVLPESEIVPVGHETLMGIQALIESI